MRMSKRSWTHGVAILALGGAAFSCVVPQDDYNSYQSRAADAQAPPSSVTEGGVDAASLVAPDASFDDTTIMMACVSALAADAAHAILFKGSIKFTRSGSGGSADVAFQALDKTATNLSQIAAGAQVLTGTATIDAHGAGTASLGAMTVLPASANAISGVDVTIKGPAVALQLESSTTLCGGLGGDITSPTVYTLQPSQTPCIILPTSGGQWQPFKSADFHCP